MSKYIVKSERPLKALPLVAVETLSSELQVVVPELTASKPMPLDFNRTWDAAKEQFSAAIIKNKPTALLGIANELNRRFTTVDKIISNINTNKRIAIFSLTSFGIFTVIGSGLACLIFGFDALSPTGVPASVGGAGYGFLFSMIPVAIGGAVEERLGKKLLTPALNSFDASYEQRVIQWARARYGVIIPRGVWVAPSDRVSEDIVYLGTQGAQKIYCFKSEQGWIIGYRDGTELPVRVEQKELVRA